MFRILVAEDDESTRLLMCEVLRQAGYEPCPAKDGVEALEVMEHYQCDLAVAVHWDRLSRILVLVTLWQKDLLRQQFQLLFFHY